MPIDINKLLVAKGGDPEEVRKSQRARFADEGLVDEIIALADKERTAKYEMEQAKKAKNDINKQFKAADAKKKEELKKQSTELTAKITELEATAKQAIAETAKKLNLIGNIVSDKVIISKDEANNKVERTWGTPNKDLVVDGETLGKLHHHEIMQCLDILEMQAGSKVAGHRGFYLKGMGVLLNQALINYGIATLIKKDYTPIQAPYFMKKSIMEATCQLSDFSENLYQVEGTDDTEGKEPLYLIATSEQPISALHMGEWIEPSSLPRRYCGYSTCFRKEAGSHGRDVWGIFRIHQFEKVEQFIYCDPSESWNEMEKMIANSELFYQGLGLPYQVINIVSGELNDAASMKYDLEAWFPGYGEFRELVSCSNCLDYQSRALEVRYALKNSDEKMYVHMLNGTMCATQRTMCCILENYQTAEGVRIPEVLQPYMGGIDFIPYNKDAIARFYKKKEDEKAAEQKGKGKPKAGGDKKQQAKAPAQQQKKQAPAAKGNTSTASFKYVPQAPLFKEDPRFSGLEAELETSQWFGGDKLSSKDKDMFNDLQEVFPPNADLYPNLFFWWSIVSKFTPAVRDSWAAHVEKAGASAAAPKAAAAGKGGKKGKKEAKKEEPADDEFDPFADDDEEDEAAAAALAKKAEDAKKKKAKAKPVAKSLIIWEVKPWGPETNLDELGAKILADIKMDGLEWKTEYKKEPVAYGVFKIVIGATVEDEKVSTDDVQEAIEALEDYVQSVDVVAFNKL